MLGIIGGSGFYNFLENPQGISVETPFGEVEFEKGVINEKPVFFIPRHGKSHSILPSQINYRANIFAANKLNITKIVATNAVGSVHQDVPPGTFAIPDQILDFTSARFTTFFDEPTFSVITQSGKKLSGVVHTDVSDPFDLKVRNDLLDACQRANEEIMEGGTLVVTNGPRFETPAEIQAFSILGGDFVGMTSAPEAFLAKELEIPYATIAVVTNYAAGLQKEITHEEVAELFSKRIDALKNLIRLVISK
ncbi:MAG: MTAP family purine nucleoside phosphorylase [Candidatus Kariarchaeaceae archaeon]|jgi:5'-methylthioadenosine phosphorylase